MFSSPSLWPPSRNRRARPGNERIKRHREVASPVLLLLVRFGSFMRRQTFGSPKATGQNGRTIITRHGGLKTLAPPTVTTGVASVFFRRARWHGGKRHKFIYFITAESIILI